MRLLVQLYVVCISASAEHEHAEFLYGKLLQFDHVEALGVETLSNSQLDLQIMCHVLLTMNGNRYLAFRGQGYLRIDTSWCKQCVILNDNTLDYPSLTTDRDAQQTELSIIMWHLLELQVIFAGQRAAFNAVKNATLHGSLTNLYASLYEVRALL